MIQAAQTSGRLKWFFTFTVLLFFFFNHTFGQLSYSPKEAAKLQDKIKSEIKTFEENDDTEAIIKAYYKLIELIPYTENRYEFNVETFRQLGFVFQIRGLYEESNNYFKGFIDYFEKHNDKLNATAFNYFDEQVAVNSNMIAVNFLKLGDLAQASRWLQKAISYTEARQDISYASALNNFGLYYYQYKLNTDSAMHYFQKSEKIIVENFPEHSLYGSVTDNIADIYAERGEYKAAAQLYAQNYERYAPQDENPEEKIDFVRWIAAGVQWSEQLIHLGEPEKALELLTETEQIFNHPLFDDELKHNPRIDYLNVLISYHVATNNFSEALKAAGRASNIKDSLQKELAQKQLNRQNLLSNIVLERIQTELMYEQQQKSELIKKQRLQLAVGILVLILAMSFMGFVYHQRKQRLLLAEKNRLLAEQKAENITLQNSRLELEVEAKKRDLADVAINLNQSLEWARNIYDRLQDIKEAKGRQRKNRMNDLETELKNKLTIDKQTEAFYARLDVLNEAFYNKLRKDYPGLTKYDIRLCSLIRLKIDNYDIAKLQNISQASLNTARYRIRKKLKLEKEEDLDLFIQTL